VTLFCGVSLFVVSLFQIIYGCFHKSCLVDLTKAVASGTIS
jgi:hypothetical protein